MRNCPRSSATQSTMAACAAFIASSGVNAPVQMAVVASPTGPHTLNDAFDILRIKSEGLLQLVKDADKVEDKAAWFALPFLVFVGAVDPGDGLEQHVVEYQEETRSHEALNYDYFHVKCASVRYRYLRMVVRPMRHHLRVISYQHRHQQSWPFAGHTRRSCSPRPLELLGRLV